MFGLRIGCFWLSDLSETDHFPVMISDSCFVCETQHESGRLPFVSTRFSLSELLASKQCLDLASGEEKVETLTKASESHQTALKVPSTFLCRSEDVIMGCVRAERMPYSGALRGDPCNMTLFLLFFLVDANLTRFPLHCSEIHFHISCHFHSCADTF